MKVKFISGEEITIDLEENTIVEIKNKIAEHKDSVLENVRLIYMGKVLKDEDTFEMHKLTQESVLTAVVKKPPKTPKISQTESTSNALNTDIPQTVSTTTIPNPNIEQNNTTADTPFNMFNKIFGFVWQDFAKKRSNF